jgi:hypothetical protein
MTSTIQQNAAAPVARLRADRRCFDGVLLAGLAGVFLVNALVSVLQPSDFTGLVERSLLGRWFPIVTGDWMAWTIGINDGLLSLCLVTAIWSPRVRPLVLAWAGLWLLAVTIIKVTSLQAFGG